MEEKVFSFMEKHEMVQPGDKVILGVSGGADSVCLLFLLLEYRKKTPIELVTVHVNHGLRPDAGADAAYVESVCRAQDVPFFLVEADVKELAAGEKCSEEDAGRRLRYRAFREAMRREGGTKIAVAHNAEDRAETMLLHLFRGSGLRGLCGIEPLRGNVIRPVLCLERREIEAYLRERGIAWRTDSTNAGDAYTRNRIRHHVLPYAEREVSGRAVAHMCRTADLISETEDFLRQQTTLAKERCMKDGNVDVASFSELPAVLQKRVILELLEGLSPTGKDVSAIHVEDVISLFAEAGNRSVSLPFGIRFRRRYGEVIPERPERGVPDAMDRKVADRGAAEGKSADMEALDREITDKVVPGRETDLPPTLPNVTFEILPWEECGKIPEKKYTKWFDCDKIKGAPILRFRQTGDYLTVSDGKGRVIHKSLKEYMITEKIPRESRGKIPVLAEGNHVLWLIGYRISEHYKVDGNTKRVLQARIEACCEESETEEKNV